jgi:hypothetical protein
LLLLLLLLGQSFAQAMRRLGKWCVDRDQFKEAIPHFEKALSINPFHPTAAFAQG